MSTWLVFCQHTIPVNIGVVGPGFLGFLAEWTTSTTYTRARAFTQPTDTSNDHFESNWLLMICSSGTTPSSKRILGFHHRIVVSLIS